MKKNSEYVFDDRSNSKYEYVVTRRKKKKSHPFITALVVLFVIGYIGSNSDSNDTSANAKPTNTPVIVSTATKEAPSSTPIITPVATATAAPTSTPTEAPTATPVITPIATATATPTAASKAKPTSAPTATPIPRLTDSQDMRFFMFSNDTVGATKHTVVGGDYEPSGKYEVVCMEGHGALTVNGRGFCFAADEYMGKANGSKTYELSTIITLNANDKLTLRNYNSSKLTLYFYYIGE